jgi:hypothetical protein
MIFYSLMPLCVCAQQLTVSGRVTDSLTGEPLPYVSISVFGQSSGSSSNADGYYTLHKVPSDTATIVYNMLGYRSLKHRLSPAQKFDRINASMVSSASLMDEVVITGHREEAFKLNQKVGMVKLTPAKIATMPQIAEKDIFRSFQLMPGVSAGNENTSGLYVRGGTPDQNLVLLDGFTVYNVDHLFGFFSAFNANAVKDVQLYKGAFEPKYGGRLSSLVEITGKEGNSKEFNTGIDLNFLSVNAFAEGPLGKKVSGLVTYRRSFKSFLYEKLSEKVKQKSTVSGPNRGTSDLVSYFDDLNAKFTYNPSANDVLSWSFYAGKDMLDNSITAAFGNLEDITKWGNTGSSLKWSRKWSTQLFSTTLLSYSNYFSKRDNTRQGLNKENQPFKAGTSEENDLKDFSVKTDFEWNLNKANILGFGYQATHNDIIYKNFQNDTTSIIDKRTKGNTYAVYLQDRIMLFSERFSILPGIRTTFFSPTNKFYYEPRVNVDFNLTAEIKLKGSAGKYYQFAKRIIKEDIMQGSRDFWVLADGSSLLPVSTSEQLIAGLSWENKDYLLDVEVYKKKLRGLSEYTLRFQPAAGKINYAELFYQGTGNARGIDILFQKKFGKYNGWAGYTLGEVLSNFPVYSSKDFYAANDIRHEFKMVHMYKWKRIDFALTWSYLTGKAYTAPTGNYQLTLPDGTVQNYFTVSEKNGLRLPDYHRLDLAATYNYALKKIGTGTIGVSLFNVYNRKNTWYNNYQISANTIIETPVNYLGLTPNISLTFKIK